MSTPTRQSGIPTLTDTSANGLRLWAERVAARLAVMLGQNARTDNARLDQVVTFRDLVDSGIAVEVPTGSTPVTTPGGGASPPPPPSGFAVARLPFGVRLTWTPASYSGRGVTEVYRNSIDNITTATRVASIADGISLFEDGYVDGSLYYYWIRFVNLGGVAGSFNSINGTASVTQPGDVTGISYEFEAGGIRIRWTGVANQDLDTYELRVGASLGTSVLIDETRSTSYLWRFQTAGTYRVFVRARTTNQAYSGSAAVIDIVIAPPPAVTLSGAFSGENSVISWLSVQGSFPLDFYEVRTGSTWAGGAFVTREFSTILTTRATWAGDRVYWVTARDVFGNYGTPAAITMQVVTPSAPSPVTAEISNNIVLLRWPAAVATLPIRTYQILKGSTLGSAVAIGEKSGLFTTVTEQAAGTYTYWVRAVDSAGNVGAAAMVSATVSAPPNYVLYSDQQLDLAAATLSSALYEAGVIVLPFNTSETYDAHYTTNSWTNDQDAITAGFPVYAEPAPTSGYAEWQIDYGAVVPATAVQSSATAAVSAGAPTSTTLISYKLNSGDPWTDLPTGESGFIPASFSYLKVRYTVTGSGGDDLMVLSAMRVRLSTVELTDSGGGTANSGDATGTLFNFNRTFIDIRSIVVTVNSTTEVSHAINFVDAPNPTGFRVLVWDAAGARATRDIYWSASGV